MQRNKKILLGISSLVASISTAGVIGCSSRDDKDNDESKFNSGISRLQENLTKLRELLDSSGVKKIEDLPITTQEQLKATVDSFVGNVDSNEKSHDIAIIEAGILSTINTHDLKVSWSKGNNDKKIVELILKPKSLPTFYGAAGTAGEPGENKNKDISTMINTKKTKFKNSFGILMENLGSFFEGKAFSIKLNYNNNFVVESVDIHFDLDYSKANLGFIKRDKSNTRDSIDTTTKPEDSKKIKLTSKEKDENKTKVGEIIEILEKEKSNKDKKTTESVTGMELGNEDKTELSMDENLGNEIGLENFQLYSKIPKVSSDIDYNSKYIPFTDAGFNWYQFFADNKMGEDLLENSHIPEKGVINLGFITSTSAAALTKTYNGYTTAASENAENDPNSVMPVIGGVLPLWSANFTSLGGEIGVKSSNSNWDHSYNFLSQIRKSGRDYSFSFGGWNHDSLGVDAFKKGYSPQRLASLYKTIIEKLDLHTIDFDVEGTDDGRKDDNGLSGDVANVKKYRKLRLSALKLLKKDKDMQQRKLKISYTLPTLPTGLRSFNKEAIVTGFKNKIIDKLFLMTMDYGIYSNFSRASIPGEMAVLGISAINDTKNLLVKSLGITDDQAYGKLGYVNMLGVNDTKQEVTSLTDMLIMRKFADKHNITNSIWSTIRDHNEEFYNQGRTHLKQGHHFDDYELSDIMNNGGRAQDSYVTGYPAKTHAFGKIAAGKKTGNIEVSEIFKNNFKRATGKEFNEDNILNYKNVINTNLFLKKVSKNQVIDAYEFEMKQSSLKDEYAANRISKFIGKMSAEEKKKENADIELNIAGAKTWRDKLREPHNSASQMPRGTIVKYGGFYWRAKISVSYLESWSPYGVSRKVIWNKIEGKTYNEVKEPSKKYELPKIKPKTTRNTDKTEKIYNENDSKSSTKDSDIFKWDDLLGGEIEVGTKISWEGRTLISIQKIWYATNQDSAHGYPPLAMGSKWEVYEN